MTRGVFMCVSAILLLFATESFSALYRITDTEDPDHPGFCNFKDSNDKSILLLKPGETKNHPTECSRVECSNNFEIEVATCGISVGPKNCNLGKKSTDPYPECCPCQEESS